jgi:hypothetical protein
MIDNDKQQLYPIAEQLLSEQNFLAAVIAGAVATVLAAAGYGIATAVWDFSYGFAAVGIGIVVGLSMQFLGRGIEKRFAVLASVYTIAGCLLGNGFAVVMQLALRNSSSPINVIWNNTLSMLGGRAIAMISMIDVFFWAIAVWFAVFLVRRPLSRAERLAIGTYKLQR